MLISHEAPKNYIYQIQKFNDYDYFLIHLYEKYDEYKEFYNFCQKNNRMIILDNSACELRGKEEYDFDKYANMIEKLKPTEYLIPDVFNDYEKNMEYFEKWMKNYKDLPGKKIVTLHGKDIIDLINAYIEFDHFDVKIAINFDECIYTKYDICSGNISMNKMFNRINFINMLIYYGIINESKEHHLLGCHLPQEFKSYKYFDWISSVDTSNPVMCGLTDDFPYTTSGTLSKPKLNIDNSQDIEYDEQKMKIIEENIKIFRSFCERKII